MKLSEARMRCQGKNWPNSIPDERYDDFQGAEFWLHENKKKACRMNDNQERSVSA